VRLISTVLIQFHQISENLKTRIKIFTFGRIWSETMAVRATVSRFPIDSDAQEASGLPWGLTVTPFAAKDENGIGPACGSNGHLLPRCENCYAYFNTYCELDQWAWNCSLCGTLNGLPSDAIARYSNPHSIPEMTSSFIDLEMPRMSYVISILILLFFLLELVLISD